jgi:DNA polymerase I
MLTLDFEFSEITNEFVRLACCTTFDTATNEIKEWWLRDSKSPQEELKNYLLSKKDEIIFSWAAIAEGRSFQSLGLDPTQFKWIDGFLEYRCLTNHNDVLSYGKQLVKGVVKTTKKPPPKFQRTEEDQAGFKPTHSLAEATYKLIGEIRDTEQKELMRELIISNPDKFTSEEQKKIQDYCTDDVKFLPKIYYAILDEYEKLLREELDSDLLQKEMLLRGKYSALTAKMESRGYPIDYRKTKNFSTSVGPLIEECQREINQLFPSVKPFRYSPKDRRFSMNTLAIKDWLKENVDCDRWMKTDGGVKKIPDLSLSLDAWTKVFDFSHSYPKDNFGAQMVRYLKLKQNMNGFVPSPDPTKKNFWTAVGPDKRVRPYFNIYGAQSSRSQPGSTSFLFLKPAWMRSLCSPKKGRAICSKDYGSEEFFISALASKDKNMIESYLSGDVYLYFAKLAGAVPMDGKRSDYKEIRNIYKQVVLSISYLQTATGLSKKLTAETGKEFTKQQAEDLIHKFYDVYTDFAVYQKLNEADYQNTTRVKLPCGWYMWGDNPNFRSAANVPIQGFGGSIMRKAVEFADELGLEVVVTLHDALYIEYDSNDLSAPDKLQDAMRRAFMFYFEGEMKEYASKIKMDTYCWSPDYEADSTLTLPSGSVVDCSNIYIDERSIEEHNQFSKYFEDRVEENYL